ncbi:MAG: hypothetical protein JWL76_1721 [Thermoleophilia bacterium]|nr:hypothetical protein [Thermoleophilia bacterium]
MGTIEEFTADVQADYADGAAGIPLGHAMFGEELVADTPVTARLAMLNRHGVIAGATGTGKTKSLQVMAEQLSAQGVPCVVADMKGDLSGLGAAAPVDGHGAARAAKLGIEYVPAAQPVEFWAPGGVGAGIPMRGTLSEFGPQLLGKVLGANETQEQVLYLVFRFADDQGLALVDLGDLRALLEYLSSDAGAEQLAKLGGVSSQSIGVLLRSIVVLEANDASPFFGMPFLQLADLMRVDAQGRGVISCIELPGVAESPAVWSAAMMWIVAELFEQLPEVGDLDKPKLVIFLDEAHLLFHDASDAFVESITRTVRLIRSKGVGVFFVTQNPADIHPDVLGQLGHRIQHALRAFTPQDQKALKAAVETMPMTPHFDVGAQVLELGIGEAIVTTLDEKGAPRPPVRTCMRPPVSSMDPLPDVAAAAMASPLWVKYATEVDPESAEELLGARIAAAEQAEAKANAEPAKVTVPDEPRMTNRDPVRPRARRASSKGGVRKILDSQAGRQMQREIVRGIFGVLKSGMKR